ncbi:ABC transporter ATP-binding protein, partial [Streptococcus suis]
KELQEEFKMTTVFVTHAMDEAVKLAERICLMQDGQVVQLGSPEELRNRPANDYVKEFIRARGGM